MGWWFPDHAASIKGCSKKVKTNLCDVEFRERRSRCFLSKYRSRLIFWTFDDHFIVAFGSNRVKKNFGEEGCRLGKKLNDFLNCKYKVTFQPDGCTEPTCAATSFIRFGFGHRLDNIRILKCTSMVFYLLVYVLVNQKGFLYITEPIAVETSGCPNPVKQPSNSIRFVQRQQVVGTRPERLKGCFKDFPLSFFGVTNFQFCRPELQMENDLWSYSSHGT